MVRSIQKKRYLIAGALTLMVFLLGLLLGLVIESKRVTYMEQQGKEQELDYKSLQIQYQFVDQLAQEKNCDAVEKTFDESVTSLETIRVKLENYDQNSNINKKEFELLKRDYYLAELRYWLLVKRTRELCGTELATVLYFFSSEKECSSCDEQAFVLTYLKKRLKDKLLIFALDSNLDEPMIPMLKKVYNLQTYPALIIEDKKFEGQMSREDILKEVCKKYTSYIEDCVPYSNSTSAS